MTRKKTGMHRITGSDLEFFLWGGGRGRRKFQNYLHITFESKKASILNGHDPKAWPTKSKFIFH